MESSIYNSEIYLMACRQFDRAANLLDMEERLRARVKVPKRCMAVSCPIELDNGNVVLYEG